MEKAGGDLRRSSPFRRRSIRCHSTYEPGHEGDQLLMSVTPVHCGMRIAEFGMKIQTYFLIQSALSIPKSEFEERRVYAET